MTHTQTTCPNRIALLVRKKGARPFDVGALAKAFEKATTEIKLKQKLLKCQIKIQMSTFNVRTLNRIGQLPELTASAIDHNIIFTQDIICIQEYRYLHSEDIKYHDNSVNTAIRGVGTLIGPRALKSLNSSEKIQPRTMVTMFNVNPCTAIICYSPTNVTEETVPHRLL